MQDATCPTLEERAAEMLRGARAHNMAYSCAKCIEHNALKENKDGTGMTRRDDGMLLWMDQPVVLELHHKIG